MVVPAKQFYQNLHSRIAFLPLSPAGLLSTSVVAASMMLMPINAQAADSFEDSQADFSRSQINDAQRAKDVNKHIPSVSSTQLFIDCTQIHNQSARLACYDTVAVGNRNPDFAKQKKQLDLGKTLQSALSGKPKIIVDDPNILDRDEQGLVDDAQVIDIIEDNHLTLESAAKSSIDLKKLKSFYRNKTYDSYRNNQPSVDKLVKANIRTVGNPVTINTDADASQKKPKSVANMTVLKKFYADTGYQPNNTSTIVTSNDDSNHLVTAKDKSKSIKQTDTNRTDTNNYFLNTEVIRSFYNNGDYSNALKKPAKRQPTNFDKQNLSEQHTTSQSLYHAKRDSDKDNHNDIHITADELGKYSALSLAYDLDVNDEVGTWRPRPHNPMYLLPLFMHDKPNRHPSTPNQPAEDYTQNDYRSPELKFQVSFKSKVGQDLFGTDADLWLGYTQQSHWQVYNEDNSRPFRAHDYMPELFLTQPVKANLPFGGRLRMLGTGFVHHSNGEDDPLSRSWNRAYVMAGAEWEKLTIMPRLWARLNTDTGSKPDDNPDIEDYYGYGDLKVFYDLDEGKSVAGTFRINPRTGKGAAQIDYIYPMDNNVNLYFNLFHGYGESIVDYNHEDTAVGIGVMLNDWRGL